MLQCSLAATNSLNDTVSCSVKLLCALLAAMNTSLFWGLIQEAQLQLIVRLPLCFSSPHFSPKTASRRAVSRTIVCDCPLWLPLCVLDIHPHGPHPPLSRHNPAKKSPRSYSKHSEPCMSFQFPSSVLLPSVRIFTQQNCGF